jgi:hypothetical protein
MAWTQADLDQLDAAIAKGGAIQRMKFADQEWEFRSADDMLKLRSVIAQAVAAATGTGATRLAATSKGV